MSLMSDDTLIPIPCPNCGKKFDKTAGWLKTNGTFTCDACGSTIRFDADKLFEGLADAEKKIADAFGKGGTIKLGKF